MATAAELVNWAASQIGVKESPANSNKVKYWDTYKANTGVNLSGNPWCAAFVSCGMWHVGAWPTGKDEGRFRYCPSLVNWAKANGQWLDRSAVCQPGDIILFANKGTACHVGIVEKRISATQVQTIEGNTSASSNDNGGAVMRRVRTYGEVGSSWYILGFVRTPWNGQTSGNNAPVQTTTTTAAFGAGNYTVTASSLNIRKDTSTNSSIVGSYKNGTVIKVTETKGINGNTWGKTDKGWIAMKYSGNTYVKAATTSTGPVTAVTNDSVIPAGTYKILASSLNVRATPSTSGSVVAKYSKGQTVKLDNYSTSANGFYWGRYTGGSGNKRYIAVRSTDGKTVYAQKI